LAIWQGTTSAMSTWQTCHQTERQQRSDARRCLLLLALSDVRLLLVESLGPAGEGVGQPRVAYPEYLVAGQGWGCGQQYLYNEFATRPSSNSSSKAPRECSNLLTIRFRAGRLQACACMSKTRVGCVVLCCAGSAWGDAAVYISVEAPQGYLYWCTFLLV
jgi:hypothetical protein